MLSPRYVMSTVKDMKVLQRNAIRLLINCVGPGALPRSRPPHQQCSVINLFPRHTASTPVDLGQARLGRLSIIVTTRPALAITITTVIVAAVDVAALVRRASFRFFLPVRCQYASVVMCRTLLLTSPGFRMRSLPVRLRLLPQLWATSLCQSHYRSVLQQVLQQSRSLCLFQMCRNDRVVSTCRVLDCWVRLVGSCVHDFHHASCDYDGAGDVLPPRLMSETASVSVNHSSGDRLPDNNSADRILWLQIDNVVDVVPVSMVDRCYRMAWTHCYGHIACLPDIDSGSEVHRRRRKVRNQQPVLKKLGGRNMVLLTLHQRQRLLQRPRDGSVV